MCIDKKVQEQFVDQTMKSIKSWFDDITTDAIEKYAEDTYNDGELEVRLDTILECSEFMERIFTKIAGEVELAPLKK